MLVSLAPLLMLEGVQVLKTAQLLHVRVNYRSIQKDLSIQMQFYNCRHLNAVSKHIDVLYNFYGF